MGLAVSAFLRSLRGSAWPLGPTCLLAMPSRLLCGPYGIGSFKPPRERVLRLYGASPSSSRQQQGGSNLSAPCVLRMLCSVLQQQQGGSRVATRWPSAALKVLAADADPSRPESSEAAREALAVLARLCSTNETTQHETIQKQLA